VAVTSREYITLDATGEDGVDYRLIRTIERAIKEQFSDNVAYQILRLESPDDIEDELRDPEPILKVSGNKLPVVLVNVTYQSGTMTAADLAPLEMRFNLRLVHELLDNQD
jgi:hypothetical protein